MSAEKRKARDRRKAALYMTVSVLAGAAVGFSGIMSFQSRVSHFHPAGWVLAVVLLEYFPVLMLHEAGHVVAGLAAGFRFYFFVAGPFCWRREDEHIAFTFNLNPALWGGRAACLPRTTTPDLKNRLLLFTAGGPLFSILGGLAILPALALRSSIPNLSLVLLFFGALSLAIAIATLIPTNMAGTTSDGARLLMLIRNHPDGMRWVAMAVVGSLTNTERARDWPRDLIELMGDGLDEKPDSATVCTLRYLWHMDRREWDEARIWLERGLEKIDLVPASLRAGLYLCAAWFEARRNGDAAAARKYFDLACRPGLQNRQDFHSIEAAVLIVEGRFAEARKQLALAEARLSTKAPAPAAGVREDLAEMSAELQRRTEGTLCR